MFFPKTTLVHHFIEFFAIYTRYFLQNKIIYLIIVTNDDALVI